MLYQIGYFQPSASSEEYKWHSVSFQKDVVQVMPCLLQILLYRLRQTFHKSDTKSYAFE